MRLKGLKLSLFNMPSHYGPGLDFGMYAIVTQAFPIHFSVFGI
jgi:hypothetical protein